MYLVVRPGMDAFGSHWTKKYEFFLNKSCIVPSNLEPENSYVETGIETTACKAIWYLFILGKRIEGQPSAWRVTMGPREAKLYYWMVESGFIRKQKFWLGMLEGRIDKGVIFDELEKELPKWLLMKKLTS